jgi:hypothetical protein
MSCTHPGPESRAMCLCYQGANCTPCTHQIFAAGKARAVICSKKTHKCMYVYLYAANVGSSACGHMLKDASTLLALCLKIHAAVLIHVPVVPKHVIHVHLATWDDLYRKRDGERERRAMYTRNLTP